MPRVYYLFYVHVIISMLSDSLKVGEKYLKLNSDSIYEVVLKHGGRYVLLPKLISTGEERSPVVIGENDANFIKKLILSSEDFNKLKLKYEISEIIKKLEKLENELNFLKKEINTKEYELSNQKAILAQKIISIEETHGRSNS